MKKFPRLEISFAVVILVGTLVGTLSWINIAPLNNNLALFAQGVGNNTNPTVSNASDTNSVPNGSINLTNFDIPSIDITLPDGSSISPDFRSMYFSGGAEGDIYAYYNDYGLPEDKPQLKVGDEFTIDAYPSNANTPKPSAIQASISRIASGDDTGNFTTMKLDDPTPLTSSGNTYSIPPTDAGSYILDVFVKYPTGGIVPVYTLQIQVAA